MAEQNGGDSLKSSRNGDLANVGLELILKPQAKGGGILFRKSGSVWVFVYIGLSSDILRDFFVGSFNVNELFTFVVADLLKADFVNVIV